MSGAEKLLVTKVMAAGLGKSRQVSGDEKAWLPKQTGLGKSRQVSGDGKSWPPKLLTTKGRRNPQAKALSGDNILYFSLLFLSKAF